MLFGVTVESKVCNLDKSVTDSAVDVTNSATYIQRSCLLANTVDNCSKEYGHMWPRFRRSILRQNYNIRVYTRNIIYYALADVHQFNQKRL